LSLYRKKPVVVTALQWTGDNTTEMMEFLQNDYITVSVDGFVIYIHTLEGEMAMHHGDWVIEGVKGEHYPCKDDIFRATYEAV